MLERCSLGVLGTGSPGMLVPDQRKFMQRRVNKIQRGSKERVWVKWVVSGSNKKDSQIAFTLAPFWRPVW